MKEQLEMRSKKVSKIMEKYNKSAAQVILRWLRQEQIIAIPKSVHEDRIRENFDVDDFKLSKEDVSMIEQLDTGKPLILDIPSIDEYIVCMIFDLNSNVS